jgi:hypothetical protein
MTGPAGPVHTAPAGSSTRMTSTGLRTSPTTSSASP